MLIPTLVMGTISIIFILMGYAKGKGQHIEGLRLALNMFVEILPILLFAFIIAGMLQILLPQGLLSKWIGKESGLGGIFIGTIAGGFCPGGPYVSLPIVAGLLRSGAAVPIMVAFLTSWSLWAISRLPMEFGILGWRFTLIRLACTFFFPPIAGMIARVFFK